MSDYGLLVKTPDGKIQIDSLYRNLSLDQSGSLTVDNDNTPGGFFTRQEITASPLVPLVPVRPNYDYFVSVRSYYKSGDDFSGVDFVTEYDHSTNIEWMVLRENLAPSSDNYGLRVYSPSNELCFDSGKDYMKIREVHSITLDSPTKFTQPYTDISHPSISDPFYVVNTPCYWVYSSPTYPIPRYDFYRFLMGMKKLSATSVRVGWMQFLMGTEPGVPYDEGLNPTFKLLVCTL